MQTLKRILSLKTSLGAAGAVLAFTWLPGAKACEARVVAVRCEKPITVEAPAELSEGQVAALKEHLAKLGDERFDVRNEAALAIVGLGKGVLPRVKSELKSAEDLEVKAQLFRIVASLEPVTEARLAPVGCKRPIRCGTE
ncbi:MAG: hypothetical protein M5U26_30460 [Planctomycetota bacterium]|nr:hypothetical protein [Planctomycetota bacterium]